MTNKATDTTTVNGLLAGMPAQFGVRLVDMATITGLDAKGCVIGTARFDLDQAPDRESFGQAVRQLIQAFGRRGEPRRVIVAAWNPRTDESGTELVQAGAETAETCGLDAHAYVVTGDTFRETFTGTSGILAGDEDPYVMRLRVQTGEPVDAEQLSALWAGQGSLELAPAANRDNAIATMTRLITGDTITDDDLSEVATALHDPTVRDAFLIEDGSMEGLSQAVRTAAQQVGYPVIVESLRQAGARMAPGHRAAFWTMAGIIAHGSGNTVPAATIQTALLAALKDDPDYRLAALASRAVVAGIRF